MHAHESPRVSARESPRVSELCSPLSSLSASLEQTRVRCHEPICIANRIAKPRAPAAEETVRRQSVMKINFAPVMKTKDLHPSLGRFFGKTSRNSGRGHTTNSCLRPQRTQRGVLASQCSWAEEWTAIEPPERETAPSRTRTSGTASSLDSLPRGVDYIVKPLSVRIA